MVSPSFVTSWKCFCATSVSLYDFFSASNENLILNKSAENTKGTRGCKGEQDSVHIPVWLQRGCGGGPLFFPVISGLPRHYSFIPLLDGNGSGSGIVGNDRCGSGEPLKGSYVITGSHTAFDGGAEGSGGAVGSGGRCAEGGSPSHTTWRDGGLGMRHAATWLTPLTCQCGHKCGPGFMLTSLTGSVLPHGNASVSPNCSGQRDLFHRLKSVTLYPPFLPHGSWARPVVRLQKKNDLKYHLHLLPFWFSLLRSGANEGEKGQYLTTVAHLSTCDSPPTCPGRWLLLYSCENPA